jgi:hypothetical protein
VQLQSRTKIPAGERPRHQRGACEQNRAPRRRPRCCEWCGLLGGNLDMEPQGIVCSAWSSWRRWLSVESMDGVGSAQTGGDERNAWREMFIFTFSLLWCMPPLEAFFTTLAECIFCICFVYWSQSKLRSMCLVNYKTRRTYSHSPITSYAWFCCYLSIVVKNKYSLGVSNILSVFKLLSMLIFFNI